MTILKDYPNVVYDTNSTNRFDQLVETEYFGAMFGQLAGIMGEGFTDYTFCLFSCDDPRVRPDTADRNGDRNVLLYLSDESASVPTELAGHYTAIFKAYLNSDRGLGNIFPLPLGCVDGVVTLPVVPVSERSLQVFFSGNLNVNRISLYKEFTPLRVVPDVWVERVLGRSRMRSVARAIFGADFSGQFDSAYIRFTKSFGDGLSRGEYAEKLYNARIALCPRGFHSPETFRHYEAARAGCVIVSQPLPDTVLYRDAPIIQSATWAEGLKTVHELLQDERELARAQEKTLAWWDARWSAEAVARYVLDCLNTRSRPLPTPSHGTPGRQ